MRCERDLAPRGGGARPRRAGPRGLRSIIRSLASSVAAALIVLAVLLGGGGLARARSLRAAPAQPAIQPPPTCQASSPSCLSVPVVFGFAISLDSRYLYALSTAPAGPTSVVH